MKQKTHLKSLNGQPPVVAELTITEMIFTERRLHHLEDYGKYGDLTIRNIYSSENVQIEYRLMHQDKENDILTFIVSDEHYTMKDIRELILLQLTKASHLYNHLVKVSKEDLVHSANLLSECFLNRLKEKFDKPYIVFE